MHWESDFHGPVDGVVRTTYKAATTVDTRSQSTDVGGCSLHDLGFSVICG